MLTITALSGWGLEVFTGYSHWWIVPLLACHLGGLLGALLYFLLLRPEAEEVEEEDVRREARPEKMSAGTFLHVRGVIVMESLLN